MSTITLTREQLQPVPESVLVGDVTVDAATRMASVDAEMAEWEPVERWFETRHIARVSNVQHH